MKTPAQILLVEDNHMDVILTIDAFKEAKSQIKIHVAKDGMEALDYLMGNGKYIDRELFPLPDIILLDLKLPGISGFDVLKQIKSTERLKRIPIIILTSSREDGDRSMSYDMGANSYLLKPVSFEGFTDVVKRIDDYWLSLNISAKL